MAMTLEEARQYTSSCFAGDAASCTYACPYHLDLRSFLKKAGRGRIDSCYKEMVNTLSFPAIACRLCSAQCQSACQRSTVGDAAVQVRELELACIALAKSHVPEVFSSVPKEAEIAVIGAGPAGLAAAFQLSQKGYPVTVYDKNNYLGGSLKQLPEYERLLEDIESKFQITKVIFELNHGVSSVEELTSYAAIILATGTGGTDFGLARSRQKNFFQTDNPRFFAIGQLCGTDSCHALAEGNAVANPVEAFLISGTAEYISKNWDNAKCSRFTKHCGEASKPVTPKSGDLYTKDEIKQEASRCMQCDCSDCMTVCEHLKKYKGTPLKYATDVYQDSQVRPPITSHSVTHAVYACNLCGRCCKACPDQRDLPGLFCFSRQNRMERGD
ncbi:MAG: FAD-dependent oxidoreductase, partial [Oscillospiraceae bacterium]|nr:FAD-dependent oxidoreductase [Oscillospiraceae bacterium]